MKDFFRKIIGSVLVVGVLAGVFAPSVSYAQLDAQLEFTGGGVQSAASLADSGEKALESGKNDNTFSCGFTDKLNPLTMINCALAGLGNVFVWAAGGILSLSAKILDFVIDISVVKFDDLAGIPGIKTAWKVGRDLANLFFIFILLYVAIGQILQLPSVAGSKFVVNIILVAIFINFSMVLARVVIDSSNVVAVEFYNAIRKNNPDDGLGGLLLKRLGPLSSINRGYDYNQLVEEGASAEPPAFTDNDLTFSGVLIGSFGGVAVMLSAAFVLIAASIMFVIRSVVLILVIVLGPLAFLTSILPNHSKLGRWWETLLNQSVFAPAYLFMTYAAFKVITTASFYTQAGVPGAGSVFSGIDQAPGLIIYFVIVIALLLSALVIAKELAGQTASFAIGATKTIGGATVGRLGRETLGRGASALGSKLDDFAVSVGQTRGGRAVMGALRVSGIAGATRGTLDYAANAKFGGGVSYEEAKKKEKETVERNIQNRAKDPREMARYYNTLNTEGRETAISKLSPRNRAALALEMDKDHLDKKSADRPSNAIIGTLSVEEQEKTRKEYAEAEFKQNIESLNKLIDENTGEKKGGLTPAEIASYDRLVKSVADTVKKKVSKVNDLKGHMLRNTKILAALSGKHLNSLAEKNELSEDDVKKLVEKINSSSNDTLKNHVLTSKSREYWGFPPAAAAAAPPNAPRGGIVLPPGVTP